MRQRAPDIATYSVKVQLVLKKAGAVKSLHGMCHGATYGCRSSLEPCIWQTEAFLFQGQSPWTPLGALLLTLPYSPALSLKPTLTGICCQLIITHRKHWTCHVTNQNNHIQTQWSVSPRGFVSPIFMQKIIEPNKLNCWQVINNFWYATQTDSMQK